MTKQEPAVCIDIKQGEGPGVFRLSAADDILRLLADAHESEFTIQELGEAVDVSRSTVWRAVDLLEKVGAISVRETPQRNYVSIDPERLQKDDPILAIEQSEFHAPIRAFVDGVEERVGNANALTELVGIVVFGSVARGEADRKSDIDVLVVVDGKRIEARNIVTDYVSELEEQRFDGDRFEFEPYVETVESAHRAGEKLMEIFTEGVTVYRTDALGKIRTEVLEGEQ